MKTKTSNLAENRHFLYCLLANVNYYDNKGFYRPSNRKNGVCYW